MLSGQGLVNSTTGFWSPALSAYRILSPSIVRNRGSIEVVCDVLMTAPSSVAAQCRKGRRRSRPVHEVGGQVVGQRPGVVLPDRLVDLRQRQQHVAREPGDRAQRQGTEPE